MEYYVRKVSYPTKVTRKSVGEMLEESIVRSRGRMVSLGLSRVMDITIDNQVEEDSEEDDDSSSEEGSSSLPSSEQEDDD